MLYDDKNDHLKVCSVDVPRHTNKCCCPSISWLVAVLHSVPTMHSWWNVNTSYDDRGELPGKVAWTPGVRLAFQVGWRWTRSCYPVAVITPFPIHHSNPLIFQLIRFCERQMWKDQHRRIEGCGPGGQFTFQWNKERYTSWFPVGIWSSMRYHPACFSTVWMLASEWHQICLLSDILSLNPNDATPIHGWEPKEQTGHALGMGGMAGRHTLVPINQSNTSQSKASVSWCTLKRACFYAALWHNISSRS